MKTARTAPQQHQVSRSFNTIDRPARSIAPRPTSQAQKRTASNGSLASKTAINAPTSVPPHLRALHQRLLLVSDKASSYTDLSRLQLALRSLETADPVLRIAFLGLGPSGAKAARRLARVLLADALSDEESWERELENEQGTSVLLRYGEAVEDRGVQSSNRGMVREMSIPSPFLRKWNIEILLTGFNATGAVAEQSTRELEESILVPPLTIPGAGRVGFVRYPVHTALLVGQGVNGAVELGRLPEDLVDRSMINVALNLPGKSEAARRAEEDSEAVDIELAAHALQLFRTDKANGAVFSSEWQASQVGSVSTWIGKFSATRDTADGLKPAVRALMQSVFSRTMLAIDAAETAAETSSTALTVPEPKRTTLASAITTWSQDAHHDLQTNLSTAFLGPAWKRTVWWRLFYRIDEVSISASDVLRRGWLVEAEQNLAFLSGRILESGLANEAELRGISVASPEEGEPAAVRTLIDGQQKHDLNELTDSLKGKTEQSRIGTVAELVQLPPLLSRIREQSGLNAFFDPPWPQTIQLARQQMLHQVVPEMHAKAQRLMLASLSTIGASGALGAWLWVATGGLYEGGAVAALGLVWALRRLQKHWGVERETFAETAREDARSVLADVEGRLRKLVSEGGRVVVREEDRKDWEQARELVKGAKELLEKVEGKQV